MKRVESILKDARFMAYIIMNSSQYILFNFILYHVLFMIIITMYQIFYSLLFLIPIMFLCLYLNKYVTIAH